MKKSVRDNYLLSGTCFLLANLFLVVLIVTRPEHLTWRYGLMLGVLGVAWVIMLLSFPFMRRLANRQLLPDDIAVPVILGLLALFFVTAVLHMVARNGLRLSPSVVIVLVVFGIGIVNIFRHYLETKKKKARGASRAKKRPRDS